MPVKQPTNVPTPVKRPSVGINPNIPVPVQRELRKVADYAFDAHSNANKALAALPEKLGRNQEDLMHISSFVSGQVQANGAHPINLTGLPIGPSGVAPGTYTTFTSITIGKDGRVTEFIP
jgi:hypothetical protein